MNDYDFQQYHADLLGQVQHECQQDVDFGAVPVSFLGDSRTRKRLIHLLSIVEDYTGRDRRKRLALLTHVFQCAPLTSTKELTKAQVEAFLKMAHPAGGYSIDRNFDQFLRDSLEEIVYGR